MARLRDLLNTKNVDFWKTYSWRVSICLAPSTVVEIWWNSGGVVTAEANRGRVLLTKSELILRLADKNPHLFQRDIERIVATVLDEISTALSKGDRVELRGFGAFSVKNRDSRVGRNPRTGESVFVSRKSVPFFKAGKDLRVRLNTP